MLSIKIYNYASQVNLSCQPNDINVLREKKISYVSDEIRWLGQYTV